MDPLSSEIVFRGRVIAVTMKRFRGPDGEEYERDVIEHPGAVGMLAYDEEFVYLVAQPREAVGAERSLEIPAGTVDPEDGSELDCAKRELAEEVGLGAEHWAQLHVIEMTPGYSNEKLTLFEATGLSAAEAEPDEDERIEIVRWPLAELDRAIAEVSDAKTLIALLELRAKLAAR
jgi:8-oxo-dGTP pyrophosphatase MutT (NUDIX family)